MSSNCFGDPTIQQIRCCRVHIRQNQPKRQCNAPSCAPSRFCLSTTRRQRLSRACTLQNLPRESRSSTRSMPITRSSQVLHAWSKTGSCQSVIKPGSNWLNAFRSGSICFVTRSMFFLRVQHLLELVQWDSLLVQCFSTCSLWFHLGLVRISALSPQFQRV